MAWAIGRGVLIAIAGSAALTALFLAGFLLVMQRGPQEAIVPDLVGMPLEKGREAAQERGLPLEIRARAYSPTVPEGSISEMRPYKNKRVKQGRRIEVVVSRGPKDVTVPDVKNLDIQAARETVALAKLHVGQVLRKKSSKPAEEVLEQQPEPGATAPRDSEVTLTVSGGPDYGELDTSEDRRLVFRKVEITVPRGDPLQTVKVEKTEGGARSLEYSRVHQPGEKLTVDVQGHEGARIVVYVGDAIAYEGTL